MKLFRSPTYVTRTLAIVFGVFGVALTVSATPDNSKRVQLDSAILSGFIEKHCQQCHGAYKQKGDLRLHTLNLEITHSH